MRASYSLLSFIISSIVIFPGTMAHEKTSRIENSLSKIFTSGYSDELLIYNVNEETHDISYDEQWKVESNFSFGHVSQKYNSIYFIHEVGEYGGDPDTGAVSRWKLNSSSPTIGEHQNRQSHKYEKARVIKPISKPITKQEVLITNGAGPCHVNLDEKNGILHVANYNGGSYIAFSVDKNSGAIKEKIYFENYGKGSNVVPDRQADAHAHMVFFLKEFIYVVDLGSDKIHHYKVIGDDIYEPKTIVKGNSTSMPPGYGPRHMTITSKFPLGEQRVYLVNELKSFISIFKFDDASGSLEDQGVVETMPPNLPGQAAAEIALHPNEKWLYCSNRVVDCNNCTNGSMLVYKVLEDGNLEKLQVQPTSGLMPRYFRINNDGSLLYVVDQNKNTLDLFEIDSATGKLTKKKTIQSGNSPTFLGIL